MANVQDTQDQAQELANANLRLRVLLNLGQELASIQEEGAILRTIYDNVSQLMDTSNMYIALYDEANDTIRFPLVYQNGQAISIQTRKAGQGKTEEIIRTKQPILHKTQKEADDGMHNQDEKNMWDIFRLHGLAFPC
ncbi:multi-sensor signal transduction histidine kinase [Candidatus Moduliflexus flocculans]|uniref:Multi-sensor signal transduction histidine kinase n=1 Tax=Candidatus Moduliflexus flocculans TaxID=1499966 RepID=A0A0S6VQ73_9BACT|nr:multi-sensor signal transduction histidine kinase [Candidatus Moduliflexus flocculans]